MRLLALMLSLVCRPLPAAELYFGLLHGHTSFSDGSGTPHDAFLMARNAGLHFMAITEHNHHQAAGSDGIFLTRALYGDLAQFANRHTVDGQFVAIFGQEVSTISSGNHFNIFYANDICDIPHGDFKALYEAWLPDHPEGQSKVINEQAQRYGIPFGGKTINLPDVVRAMHDFLADNALKLAREDDVYSM